MIGARELAHMKPTAFLINCARGKLVDEAALLAALESGALAGAALDVRVVEPIEPGDTLLCRDDVLSTPHAGAFTLDALDDLYAIVIGHIQEALR
jgi:phosphoglycerate dehydrogenase-like enzyme